MGKFENFAAHSDAVHLLCLSDKRAAFLKFDFSDSSVKGLPKLNYEWRFLGDSKLAAPTTNNNRTTFRVFDLAKPKTDLGSAYSAWLGSSFFLNKDRDLVAYKDGAPPHECVVARVESKGLRQISRWKCKSAPQLSPSGKRAWSGDAFYEVADGSLLHQCDRQDSGKMILARWLGESRVLEMQALKTGEEDETDSSQGNTYVMWEAESGRVLLKRHEPRAVVFEVSPDGNWIAEGGVDGRLRIRSAQTLEIQKDYKVHESRVSTVSWHPSKPVVFTGSMGDHWVRAWDTRDGSLVQGYRCKMLPISLDVNIQGNLLGIGHWSSPTILPIDFSHVRD